MNSFLAPACEKGTRGKLGLPARSPQRRLLSPAGACQCVGVSALMSPGLEAHSVGGTQLEAEPSLHATPRAAPPPREFGLRSSNGQCVPSVPSPPPHACLASMASPACTPPRTLGQDAVRRVNDLCALLQRLPPGEPVMAALDDVSDAAAWWYRATTGGLAAARRLRLRAAARAGGELMAAAGCTRRCAAPRRSAGCRQRRRAPPPRCAPSLRGAAFTCPPLRGRLCRRSRRGRWRRATPSWRPRSPTPPPRASTCPAAARPPQQPRSSDFPPTHTWQRSRCWTVRTAVGSTATRSGPSSRGAVPLAADAAWLPRTQRAAHTAHKRATRAAMRCSHLTTHARHAALLPPCCSFPAAPQLFVRHAPGASGTACACRLACSWQLPLAPPSSSASRCSSAAALTPSLLSYVAAASAALAMCAQQSVFLWPLVTALPRSTPRSPRPSLASGRPTGEGCRAPGRAARCACHFILPKARRHCFRSAIAL